MPPKKAAAGNAKAKLEQKKKVVEEKTFGLKNKNKSKKVQQKIEQMRSSVTAGDREAQKKAEAKKAAAEEKRMLEIRRAEAAALMAGSVVIKQKEVPPGVDPKSVVCEFFRHQRCNKGAKCKFAHDLKAEMKVAKIDLFSDTREAARDKSKEEDTMESWDADKLAQVVDSKQDTANRNLPTKIVCKYFLEAIENNKYGWFWECPNGGKKCQYRHALPEGYVLKRDKKRLDEERDKGPTLEELIEHERNKIGVGTPVNEATFAAWMRRKRRAAARKRLADQAAREVAIKQGKEKMSGRETFLQNPSLLNADADDDADALEFDRADLADADAAAAGAGAADEQPDDTPMKVWESTEYQLRDDDDAADAADLAILVAAKAEAKRKYDAGAAQRAIDAAEKAAEDAANAAADDDDDEGGDDDDDDDEGGDDDDDEGGDEEEEEEEEEKGGDDAANASTSQAAAAPAIDASVFAGENVDELPDFSDDEK